jgi:nitrile hydratase
LIRSRRSCREWRNRSDPDYRVRLLNDPKTALAEFQFHAGEMAVVENTPTIHNVVVCTLCSCYPWPLLGIPPLWYKSLAYRSSMVREARTTLRDMGTDLPPDVEIRVWDSSAEVRYLVLPQRPAGAENLSEGDLAALVTRDSMIGVERL